MNAKLIIIGFSLLICIGCHKNNDTATPQEDLAAQVMGTYQVKTLTINGKSYTLPDPSVNSTLSVSRVGSSLTDLSVGGSYQIISGNAGQQETFTQSAPLIKQGNTITFTSTTSIGKMDGTYTANQLTVQYVKPGGSTVILVAAK